MMPNRYTSADLWYPSGADYSFGDPVPDYIRAHTRSAGGSGSLEVVLPPVQGDIGTGARVTLRNFGDTHDLLVNPQDGELIEGSANTLRVEPGQRITLQGGPCSTLAHQGAFGWEVVG